MVCSARLLFSGANQDTDLTSSEVPARKIQESRRIACCLVSLGVPCFSAPLVFDVEIVPSISCHEDLNVPTKQALAYALKSLCRVLVEKYLHASDHFLSVVP